jgi:membrane protein
VGRGYGKRNNVREVIVMQINKDVRNLFYRFRDDDVMALAAQLSYSLLVSFFPFLIFIMTLIGFSPIKSADVLAGLHQVLPSYVFQLIRDTVVGVVETKNSNLLSLSLIITIWTASIGFKAVIKGINKAYDVPETRSFLRLEATALLCTFALSSVILLTMLSLVLGELIGNSISLLVLYPEDFKIIGGILRYFIIFCVMVFVFAALYRYTPSKRLHWGGVFPGALFSSICWISVSAGFSFYVNNFGNYSRIYGSIGVIIVLLTWLFLTSIIIIMGGEINAAIFFDREGKEKPVGKKF